MNTKELEILKKLLKIAENQQKLIVRLAQEHRGINPIDPNAPIGTDTRDPLHSGLEETQTPQQVTERMYKNFPYLKPQTAKQPAAPAKALPSAAPLPSNVQMALRNAPTVQGYKGSLYLQVDGNNALVKYNADKELDSAQEVTTNIQSALPGYKVTVIGENNPNWTANF